MWRNQIQSGLARGRKIRREPGDRQRSRALFLWKEARCPAVHAGSGMKLDVRRTIPDVGTGATGGAPHFGRLAHDGSEQERGREAFHRRTWAPTT